jgi:hypothetical protein
LPEGAADRTAGEHFFVMHPDELRPQAAVALSVLDEGRRSICGELGLTTDRRITVVLLAPAAFRALTGNPRWVRGAYDGRILVPVGGAADGGGLPALRAVLLHELTHALLREAVGASLPPWFEEGLAERFEGTTAAAAEDWLSRRRAPRVAGLDGIDDAIRSGGWREEAGHHQARVAVQELEALGGEGASARILASLRAGAAFSSALDAAVPGGRASLERRLQSPRAAPQE